MFENEQINETGRVHEEATKNLLSFEYYESGLREMLRGTSSVEDAKKQLESGFGDFGTAILGDKGHALNEELKSLLEKDFSSVDGLIDETAQKIVSFLQSNSSLEELEEIERRGVLKNENNSSVNELMYYTFIPGSSELDINVHNSVAKGIGEKMNLFKNGLRIIAERLSNDPDLLMINTIAARSWIVENHPDLVRRMGFTIDGSDKAHISRQDFLNRYST